jgi:predicted PurR-regulated permease PerM
MIGFTLFGVGTPVLLGILYGIASFVPGIGALLVWVPVALFQVLQGNIGAATGIVAWSVLQWVFYENYLGPVIIERRARLHPFLILLGVLGGIGKFGLLGIFLGPTMVALGLIGLELLCKPWTNHVE